MEEFSILIPGEQNDDPDDPAAAKSQSAEDVFSVLLVGRAKVGKSSLAQSALGVPFLEKHFPTLSLQTPTTLGLPLPWAENRQRVVEIWDPPTWCLATDASLFRRKAGSGSKGFWWPGLRKVT